MRALRRTARVPEVLAVCEDAAVIGAPFYVMTRLEGTWSRPPSPQPLERRRGPPPHGRSSWSTRSWRSTPSTGGPRAGGLGRPAATSSASCAASADCGSKPHAHDPRRRARPAPGSPSHLPRVRAGDDRPRRLPARQRHVRAAAPARLVAVLRLGDGDDRRPARRPRLPHRPVVGRATRRSACSSSPGHARGGVPEPGRARRPLRGASGRTMTDMRWYQTLALWKAAIFMEGNYRRAVTGATDDPYLRASGRGVRPRRARARAGTGLIGARRRVPRSTAWLHLASCPHRLPPHRQRAARRSHARARGLNLFDGADLPLVAQAGANCPRPRRAAC